MAENNPEKNGEVKSPKFQVSLPVPDREVVGMTDDDAVRMRYIESIEKIAKLESETLIQLQTLSNKHRFHLSLILAGLLAVGGAALFGLKLEGKCGNTGVSVEPQKIEKPNK